MYRYLSFLICSSLGILPSKGFSDSSSKFFSILIAIEFAALGFSAAIYETISVKSSSAIFKKLKKDSLLNKGLLNSSDINSK